MFKYWGLVHLRLPKTINKSRFFKSKWKIEWLWTVLIYLYSFLWNVFIFIYFYIFERQPTTLCTGAQPNVLRMTARLGWGAYRCQGDICDMWFKCQNYQMSCSWNFRKKSYLALYVVNHWFPAGTNCGHQRMIEWTILNPSVEIVVGHLYYIKKIQNTGEWREMKS